MGQTVGLKLFQAEAEKERLEAERLQQEAEEQACPLSPRSAEVCAIASQVRASASSGDVVALKATLGEVGSLVHSEVVRMASADGELAIHLAAARGHIEVLQLLVETKAQLEATQLGGNTPLLVASAHGQYQSVEWLLSQGVDTGATDNTGKTAVHQAAISNHGQIFQLLVRSSADLMAVDHAQKTALELISDMEQWQLSCSAASDINHPYYNATADSGSGCRPRSNSGRTQ